MIALVQMRKTAFLPVLLGLVCLALYLLVFRANGLKSNLLNALLSASAAVSWSAATVLIDTNCLRLRVFYISTATIFAVFLVEFGAWSGAWPVDPLSHRFLYLIVLFGALAVSLYRQLFERRVKDM